jgi:hypothetical protein
MRNHLTIHYEGYWQCRQATDPDPSLDPRGASGYTFAIGAENDFDQVIRLQRDEIPAQDFREAWPAASLPESHAHHGGGPEAEWFGVYVSKVEEDGRSCPAAEQVLKGAKVRWLPAGDPRRGPRFELRNTVIFHPGNNSGIFMPIVPFHLLIEGPGGLRIGRDDPLVRERPNEAIWEMADSSRYARRCPLEFFSDADEALLAIGLSSPEDYVTYFQQRREWLELELTQVEAALEQSRRRGAPAGDMAAWEVRREAILNRLYVIRTFTSDVVGNRLGTRLGLLARWDFELHGTELTLDKVGGWGGRIPDDPGLPWRVRFWMGSYDGDTMRGYLRGWLQVPFAADGPGTSMEGSSAA